MISCQRDQFELPADVAYLNCAYFSPVARRVAQKGEEGIAAQKTPYQVVADDFFEGPARCRAEFARIIGAPVGRIAILPSVSYGMATVARNLPLKSDDEIVQIEEEFPSCVYTWLRSGARIKTVPHDKILDAIDGRTRMDACRPSAEWEERRRSVSRSSSVTSWRTWRRW